MKKLSIIFSLASVALFSACTMYDTFDEDLLPSNAIAEESSSSSIESDEKSSSSHDDRDEKSSSSSAVVDGNSSGEEAPAQSSSSDAALSSSSEGESSSSSEEGPAYDCSLGFKDSRSDAAKKSYKTVQIGKQCWFAENMNYEIGSDTYCYGDDAANCDTYGRLYSWSDAKDVCPEGSHLPSSAEWEALKTFVSSGKADVAGMALKAVSGWSNDGNGSDKWGFAALPGGYFDEVRFKSVESQGFWWTKDVGESGNDYAVLWYLKSTSKELSSMEIEKSNYLSVRCIVD